MSRCVHGMPGEQCLAKSPDGYECTRPQGHKSNHWACAVGRHRIRVWRGEEDAKFSHLRACERAVVEAALRRDAAIDALSAYCGEFPAGDSKMYELSGEATTADEELDHAVAALREAREK